MKEIRVRYAPSPTGLLHIGNARTALFNYLFAKHHGGKVIIRIEDTDIKRHVKGGEKSQLNDLEWLGIEFDESPQKGGPYGPYRQLERLELYQKYAHQLLEAGMASKDYKEGSEDYAIRFKVPKGKEYRFNDMVRGEMDFSSEDVEDWIILKDNGIPTYNFAVVIDDHFMKISHVLRGEEHITNTPKQIMIYQAFGWEIPLFGHMAIIVNEEKKKLSKRDKNIVQFISEYKNLGYLPEALFNFISLLGWSPSINEEILSAAEIIALFDEKRLTKAPSMFDKEKLKFINHTYLKNSEIEKLMEFLQPFLIKLPQKDSKWQKSFVELFQDRLEYGAQIISFYQEYFQDDEDLAASEIDFLKEDAIHLEVIKAFEQKLKVNEFNEENIKTALKEINKELKVRGKTLYMPTRISATHKMHGPELAKLLILLGHDKVMKNIEKTLKVLEEL
ncbi:MAG TPA: glutamate--tRNA ligase [Acholeplasmataceae bacterium]|nr:glutamate--tRNA ligase [Acholeplasmataceae bacterium]